MQVKNVEFSSIDLKMMLFYFVIVFISGFTGSYFTFPKIQGWYAGINKPWFNPPNWIFSPVWTFLYLAMIASAYLVYKTQGSLTSREMVVFYIQLILNSLWSILFFGFNLLFLSFIEIIILDLTILLMIVLFAKIDKIAGYLQIPYLLWVTFASILTLNVWLLN